MVLELLVQIRVGDAASDSVLKLPLATLCLSTFTLRRVEVVDEFFANRDWPVASAVSVVLLLILVVPMMWFQRMQSRLGGGAA